MIFSESGFFTSTQPGASLVFESRGSPLTRPQKRAVRHLAWALDERSNRRSLGNPYVLPLSDLDNFENTCLECNLNGYVHGSIIFNAFIFCTFFNEYTAHELFDDWNFFPSIIENPVFLMVSAFTFGAQIFLIELGGEFLKTSPLTIEQWAVTVALGAIGVPIGILMRWIPVKEDPNSFFDNSRVFKKFEAGRTIGSLEYAKVEGAEA